MFVFYAEKNRLYVMEKELITSGSANIYPVRFEFSPDWDGLERTAIFQAGCRKKSVPIVDGVCSVPAEVLSDPGRYLMMGVCGKQGESVVLPTVWANLGWIVEGAVPGGNPLPEDWQEALDGKGDTLAYTEEGELGLYSGDKLLSSVPIEGGGRSAGSSGRARGRRHHQRGQYFGVGGGREYCSGPTGKPADYLLHRGRNSCGAGGSHVREAGCHHPRGRTGKG